MDLLQQGVQRMAKTNLIEATYGQQPGSSDDDDDGRRIVDGGSEPEVVPPMERVASDDDDASIVVAGDDAVPESPPPLPLARKRKRSHDKERLHKRQRTHEKRVEHLRHTFKQQQGSTPAVSEPASPRSSGSGSASACSCSDCESSSSSSSSSSPSKRSHASFMRAASASGLGLGLDLGSGARSDSSHSQRSRHSFMDLDNKHTENANGSRPQRQAPAEEDVRPSRRAADPIDSKRATQHAQALSASAAIHEIAPVHVDSYKWPPASPADEYCFLCEKQDDRENMLKNKLFRDLLALVTDRKGTVPDHVQAQMVLRKYNEDFREAQQGKEWTLNSIHDHCIGKHIPNTDVMISHQTNTIFQCMLKMEETSLCLVDQERGQVFVNRGGLRDYLAASKHLMSLIKFRAR